MSFTSIPWSIPPRVLLDFLQENPGYPSRILPRFSKSSPGPSGVPRESSRISPPVPLQEISGELLGNSQENSGKVSNKLLEKFTWNSWKNSSRELLEEFLWSARWIPPDIPGGVFGKVLVEEMLQEFSWKCWKNPHATTGSIAGKPHKGIPKEFREQTLGDLLERVPGTLLY